MERPAKNRAITRLHRQIRGVLERSGQTSGKLLVVAVSGGPDSLALLYALNRLKDELGLRLHGAHLNHRLRGDASESDARFVAKTFRSLGIAFTLEEADVASFRQQNRLSLEEAAREVRYTFLAKVATENQADTIALGHTSDDQAETVLMHIVRGSGLTGLRGMEEVTRRVFDGNETTLVRPLLQVPRKETLAYCRALQLEPRQDDSNLSSEFMRNRVRLELIPLLERYNPAVRDALVRLSRSASRDMTYIQGQVDRVWRDVVNETQDCVALNRSAFALLEPAIKGHLMRRAVSLAKGDLEDVEQNHIDDMVRLMAGQAGRSLDLPGSVRFSVGYAVATLTPIEQDQCPLPPLDDEHWLKIPGETLLVGWRVTARVWDKQARSETSGYSDEQERVAVIDYESVGEELWVRPRRPGDRFQPLGMSQSKKLQDFMVDSKIPRSWRDRVPLVVSPGGIVWVVGWRIAEKARPESEDARRLELRFTPR